MGEFKEDNLLCCPFCGSEVGLDAWRGYRDIMTGRMGSQVAIYCNTCPCDMVICRDDVPGAITEQLVQELTESWNNRLNPAGWRDVVDELPEEAQEVLFVRDNKVIFGAWIGGIFWHNNTKMAAAFWMPIPLPPRNT